MAGELILNKDGKIDLTKIGDAGTENEGKQLFCSAYPVDLIELRERGWKPVQEAELPGEAEAQAPAPDEESRTLGGGGSQNDGAGDDDPADDD